MLRHGGLTPRRSPKAGRRNMATSGELLSQALQYHQAGQLAQAEQLYWQILEADPAHADAWGYLGVLHLSVGRLPQAENCCRQALRLQPQDGAALSNLGMNLGQQGKLDEAA